MDHAAVFDAILPLFRKHVSLPNLEMEIRLGRRNGNYFDTNVGKDTYETVMTALKKYTGWESTTSENTEVFLKGDIRMIINEGQDIQSVHRKVSVEKADLVLKDRPLDARVSFAQEIPVPDFDTDSEMEGVRGRERHSFVRKNLRIDCTVVNCGDADPDSEEETSYQVEMEIVDVNDVANDTELFNIVYKLQDILDVIK
jgi:hypothetical protein